jgi:hypothetical protein
MKKYASLVIMFTSISLSYGSVPAYVISGEDARQYVMKYCRVECEENLAKPRLPYRATFEKAVSGNFDALYTVFTNENYHTNDISWETVPWHILQVVGDARFADFVLSRPPTQRSEFAGVSAQNVGQQQQAAFEAYFRKRFPRTYALRQTYEFPPEPERKGLDYALRHLTQILAAQPRFASVRLYKRGNEREGTLVIAPKSLSKKDTADLRALIQKHLGDKAELAFR